MKITYRLLRVGSLIQKYDAYWCSASGEYRTNLDDMKRFRGNNYRRIDREGLRNRKWKRPIGLTPIQKRRLERHELAKINASRKECGIPAISQS